MANLLLYVVVVLVWGSSWYAIKFQIGAVPPEASVIYRFVIAAACMFAWAAVLRLPLRFSPAAHLRIALQGVFIFCINYFLFYHAAAYLTTGLIAVVTSTASIMTMLMNAGLTRRPPQGRTVLGALLGVAGIAAVFWPELTAMGSSGDTGFGLMLALVATLSFAAGGVIAARNQADGYSVRGSTAWAMAYGVIVLCLFSGLQGTQFTFDTGPAYVGSLVFLSLFSTVLLFACYFALIARIGSDRAAYATVIVPVVALTISTVFEGYTWSALGIFGVALTLLGNALVLTPHLGETRTNQETD